MERGKKKHLYQRIPKDSIGMVGLVKEISKKTGFLEADIRFVLYTMSDVIIDTMKKKQSVKIANIGTIFPLLMEERIGNNMKGGTTEPEKMVVSSRFRGHFRFFDSFKDVFRGIEPTQEDLDDMYHPKE